MVLRHFQVKSLYFIVTTNAFFFYLINHPILLTVFLSPSYPSHHFTIPPLSPSNPSHHLTIQPSNHLTIPPSHNPTLLTIPQSHPSHISLTDPLTISPSHPYHHLTISPFNHLTILTFSLSHYPTFSSSHHPTLLTVSHFPPSQHSTISLSHHPKLLNILPSNVLSPPH